MTNEGEGPHDVLTTAVISSVAYICASLVHEALGHGIAALVVGVAPNKLTSISLDIDWISISRANVIFIGAAGTIANLIVGLILLWLLRYADKKNLSPNLRYFLWTAMTVNILHGAGYFPMVWFFGDWKYVFAASGLEPSAIWKAVLSIIGMTIYLYFGLRSAGRHLDPFLGTDVAERASRARLLTWIPYFVGSSVLCLAALLNPLGSGVAGLAAAEWFGGTSLLFFLAFVVEKPRPYSKSPLQIGRSYGWIIAGSLSALAFIVILGRGITFGH